MTTKIPLLNFDENLNSEKLFFSIEYSKFYQSEFFEQFISDKFKTMFINNLIENLIEKSNNVSTNFIDCKKSFKSIVLNDIYENFRDTCYFITNNDVFDIFRNHYSIESNFDNYKCDVNIVGRIFGTDVYLYNKFSKGHNKILLFNDKLNFNIFSSNKEETEESYKINYEYCISYKGKISSYFFVDDLSNKYYLKYKHLNRKNIIKDILF